MIISASRRTDIPAFYTDWFFERLRQEYVLVRNPYRYHQITRVNLSPSAVDGFVFWTKNPIPMLKHIDRLSPYPYYFQCTITPYGKDIEPHVPSKQQCIIPALKKLSQKIGSNGIVWRYDPILLSPQYTAAYHIKYFHALAKKLHPYTDTCIISFLDCYTNIKKVLEKRGITTPSEAERLILLQHFSDSAHAFGLRLYTCAEDMDYTNLGIQPAACIDTKRLSDRGKFPLQNIPDKNQRPACGCAQSVDIGSYNTCANGCIYCYANHSCQKVLQNRHLQSSTSPILGVPVCPEDTISDKKSISLRISQLSF